MLCTWSTAATSIARHRVSRVHARSVVPGLWSAAIRYTAATGSASVLESTIKRLVNARRSLLVRLAGALLGHQITTGSSGSSSGSSTDSACASTSPENSSVIISEADVEGCNSAFKPASLLSPRIAISIREGCSAAASKASVIAR